MLNGSINTNPQVEQIIKDLVTEEFSYEQNERRSIVREHFARPVSVTLADAQTFLTFSRNFSPAGIGLLSNRPIAEGESGTLAIYRLKDEPTRIVAECRWCRKFGSTWYLSGWKFSKLDS